MKDYPRQNPFPAPATMEGNQVLSGSCSEVIMTRLVTGNLVVRVAVVSVQTVGMPLEFSLTYNSRDDVYTSELGHLWRHSYMMSLNITSNLVVLIGPDGRRYPFPWDSGASSWKQDPDSFYLPAELVDAATEWRLEFQDGRVYVFEHPSSGSARLLRLVDANGNVTTLTWSGPQLSSVAEPTGRTVTLSYYPGGSYTGFLSAVTDPRGKTTTLLYTGSSGSEKLWRIVGPEGCVLEYSYKPGSNLLEKRTDPRLKELGFEYYGPADPYPDQLKRVVDAERDPAGQIDPTYTGELHYDYGTVEERVANGVAPYQVDFLTRLTDARGKIWEYRFDPSGNLWRVIDPLGRHTRNYWDRHQRLLYTSAGYPPAASTPLGPIDNANNSFWRRVHDNRGNLVQALDPSGLLTSLTYDASNRLLSVTPGRAHFGVKGFWASEFGSDGWILCGFDAGLDRQRLPSYIRGVVSDSSDPMTTEFLAPSRSLIEASTPFGRDTSSGKATPERQIAFWKPLGTATHFSFRIQLVDSEAARFNLSLYTHSADLASEAAGHPTLNPYPFAPLHHHEQYGRALLFRVTDLDGTREFNLPSDGAGVWTTFAVRGSSSTDVLVQVEATAPYNTSARLAAVAFDPVQSRTTSLAYDAFGNVIQVVDPLGNATGLTYSDPADPSGPGYRLLESVTDPRVKVTRFFYGDAARNLTRLEDPAGKSTWLTYDENSNLLSVRDADNYTTTLTWDDRNRLLSSRDNADHETLLEHDESGNLTSLRDAQSRFTRFTHTNMNRLRTIADDDGNTWTLDWDKAGNLASMVDPRGSVTSLEYDDAGQLLRVVQPDLQQLEVAHDALGRVVATLTPNGTQAPEETPTLGLVNLLANPGAEEQDPYDGIPGHARFWAYPDLERSTGLARTGAYSLKQWGIFYYGGAHKPLPVLPGVPLLARGFTNSPVTGYDGWFEFVDYGLDGTARSQTPKVAEVRGQSGWLPTTPWRYVPPPMAQKGELTLTLRAYAPTGSVASDVYWDDLELLPLGTGYRYDASGRLGQVVLPDGAVYRFQRDRFGNVSRTIDPLGRATEFTYDGLDRLVKVTDASGDTYELAYDDAGNLVSFLEPGLPTPTLYGYDDVGRLQTITYPDSSTETFAYRDNGDLLTYTDTSGRVFTFGYDSADRLQSITPPGTPSSAVTFTYGDAGYLATRTERNADLSTFTRNDLYQVTREVMAPGPGSQTAPWVHEAEFDASGNRRLLKSARGIAIYGDPGSSYGLSRFGVSGPETVWSIPEGLAGHDAMNRLKRFLDADGQATDFAYDAEGRRTSIAHPNGTVTEATYDFMGRLLGLLTTRNGSALLNLAYRYDRKGNRVRQIADGTTFDYRLDDDDRLVGESINCMSVRSARELRKGITSGTDTVRRPGKLVLLGWDNSDDASDTFAGSVLDLDRWRPVLSETNLSGFRIRQDDGLELLFPEGFTNRVIYQDTPVRSNYGLSTSAVWCGVEHRRTLAGDFQVEVDFDSLQQVTSAVNGVYGRVRVGLLVDAQPTERREGPLAAIYRTVDPATLGDVWESLIQPTAPPATAAIAGASGATSGSLRIQRVSGQLSTWFRPANGNWTQLGATTGFAGDGLHVALLLEASYAPASVRFRNFAQSGQSNYPTAGTYESEVYDSGQDDAEWGNLTWTESLPVGTDVIVDVATQASTPFGAWNYTGAYTDPFGSSLSGRTGRYLRFRVTLVGGASTPEVSNLRLTFATGWQDRAYGFDGRGNMTSKEVVSASGVVSETRSFNSLNQILQNVVTGAGTTTWLYTWVDGQGKNPGNLLQKRKSDNSEIWDYTWDEDNRLIRVVRTLMGQVDLDVAYTYDSLGRMLTRKLSTDANPTRFEWDGWDLVREVDPAGVETVYYAPQGEILSFKRGNEVYQVHADALGSVRGIGDSTGVSVVSVELLTVSVLSGSVPGIACLRTNRSIFGRRRVEVALNSLRGPL